jgi:hypothetical protein
MDKLTLPLNERASLMPKYFHISDHPYSPTCRNKYFHKKMDVQNSSWHAAPQFECHPMAANQSEGKPNALCEFWYNTNWRSSLEKIPFVVIYGRQLCYFGATASSTIAPGDVNAPREHWSQLQLSNTFSKCRRG